MERRMKLPLKNDWQNRPEGSQKLPTGHRAMARGASGSDLSAQGIIPPQLANCPPFIRILPGVVMRSLPSRSTM
jgi:hypothetical protein